MHAWLKCCAFTILFFISTQMKTFAQVRPAAEQQVKAAFIYNFTRFLDWPAEAYSSTEAPFVIGVLGNDPVSTYLNDLVQDEMLGQHHIIIQRFTDIKQVDACNILFISSDEARKSSTQISTINRKGILTVSDVPEFCKWGGVIRFYKEGNKLRLQINPAEAKAAQLTISSKLLSIASIYKGR